MVYSRRFWIESLAALLAAGSLAGHAVAQGNPTKPITIFVAYPVGGPADRIARSIGEIMAPRLRQPVLIESKPGAGGQIAAASVLSAPADGHALLLADTSTLGINSAVYPKFSYKPLQDFEAVAPLMEMPMVLYVPAASPYNTLAELIAASRTKSLNYASQGPGSIGHVLGETLNAETDAKSNHVPYKGGAQSMLAVLSGQVDFLFGGFGEGLQHVKAGKLKMLAVAGPKRLVQAPDLPTTVESGLGKVDLSLWFGIVVRTGTAAPIVKRLHAEIEHAIGLPQVANGFTELGFRIMTMPVGTFAAFIKAESEKSAALVKARNISLD